jgi:hypothetical protein
MRFSVLLRRLMSDKEVVLEAVKQGGYSGAMRFSVLLRRLMSDQEVVLEAVKQGGHSGYALQRASEGLMSDKEVVLKAVKQGGYSGYALQRASEEADERQGGRAGGCEAGWLFRLCASACF